MRSARFEAAPPKINESPRPVGHANERALQKTARTATSKTADRMMSAKVLRGDGDAENKLNATPGFSVWVMLKKPGITRITAPLGTDLLIHALDI